MMDGAELKKTGQTAALVKSDSWRERAMYELRRFLAVRPLGLSFTFDDFRMWAEPLLDPPRSLNAWGGLPRTAMAQGLIKATDRTAKAKRPDAHARVVKVWQVAH